MVVQIYLLKEEEVFFLYDKVKDDEIGNHSIFKVC